MTWSWPDKTWNILCSFSQWNTSQSKFRNHYFFFICVFHTVPTFSDLGLYKILFKTFLFPFFIIMTSLCFQCLCRSMLRVLSEVLLLFYRVLLKNLCLKLKILQWIGNKTTDWKYMTLLMVKSLWKDRTQVQEQSRKLPWGVWEETSPSNSTTFNTDAGKYQCYITEESRIETVQLLIKGLCGVGFIYFYLKGVLLCPYYKALICTRIGYHVDWPKKHNFSYI